MEKLVYLIVVILYFKSVQGIFENTRFRSDYFFGRVLAYFHGTDRLNLLISEIKRLIS